MNRQGVNQVALASAALLLVSSACPATSGSLELPALGSDHGLDVGAGNAGGAKLSVGFPGGAPTLQEDGVLASGGHQGQLIEGQNLASVLQDALAGLLGDAEGDDGESLGDLEDPVVLGDGADDDGDFVLTTLLGHQSGDAGERDGRPVDSGHEQAAEDDAVELGIGTTGQETVELEKYVNSSDGSLNTGLFIKCSKSQNAGSLHFGIRSARLHSNHHFEMNSNQR